MYLYIYIEDLAANALIEAMTRWKKSFLTYSEIEAYGTEVVNLLKTEDTSVMMLLSRERKSVFLRDYSDYFVEESIDGQLGLRLQDGITVDDLTMKFRGYLALDVLFAFMNDKCAMALGA